MNLTRLFAVHKFFKVFNAFAAAKFCDFGGFHRHERTFVGFCRQAAQINFDIVALFVTGGNAFVVVPALERFGQSRRFRETVGNRFVVFFKAFHRRVMPLGFPFFARLNGLSLRVGFGRAIDHQARGIVQILGFGFVASLIVLPQMARFMHQSKFHKIHTQGFSHDDLVVFGVEITARRSKSRF